MITADRMERVGPVGRWATPHSPCGSTAPKDRRPGPCSHDRRPAACAPVAPASAPPSGSTTEALAPSPVLREALITRKRRVQGSGPSPAGSSPRAPKGVMPLGPALYVGTDISEAMNRTRFLDPGGTEVGRGFSSANDLPGSEALADEAMRRARTIEATEIRWGLEATNLFWWHLATYLTTNPELLAGGLRCWVFNPRQVAGFKEAYGDLGKGDWVDALVIADRLRFGRLTAECYLDERYQPLQRLTRRRRHLVKTLVREKQVALGYVYLKLSAYHLTRPLADTFGATSQVLLTDYLTPDEIVAAPLEDLAVVIAREGRDRK